jgi:hypothetical protein
VRGSQPHDGPHRSHSMSNFIASNKHHDVNGAQRYFPRHVFQEDNAVTYFSDYIRDMDWMIRFIDTLYTALETTGKSPINPIINPKPKYSHSYT